MGFMTNFVPVLKSEIAELEADISANPDPRLRKLRRLKETLAEYEPSLGKLLLPNQPQPNGNGSLPAATPQGLVGETKAARMKAHIDGALRKSGKMHRKVLLEGLLAAGIMGKETDPLQALAIFLTGNKDSYESDGSGNYSLREG
jgi:hypothetical protein